VNTWSSKLAFILASIGAAVGIGNIWRFSSVVGQNGGGAFLVPYAISVVMLAVPLMLVEFAAGRRFRGTLVSAARAVNGRLSLVGWLIYSVVFAILSYYLVITGWTLAFFSASAVGMDMTFADFTSGVAPIVFFIIVACITGGVVAFGVRRGIEKLNVFALPLAALILVLLVAYSATLPGFRSGVEFLFEPDFSVLDSPSLWSAALGQALFSLSVGFGVLLLYAAYMDREANLVHSAWIIAIADVSAALLAGLAIFPIVFSYGLEPTLGAELAFTTLPLGFDAMPGGWVVAPAFFLLLFFAALTSAVSMLEVNVAAVAEATNMGRTAATVVLTALVVALGMPAAVSYSALDLRIGDIRVLDFMDDTLGTLGLPLGGLLIAVVFRWIYRQDLLRQSLGPGPMTRALSLLAGYVIPPTLFILVAWRAVSTAEFAGWRLLPDQVTLSPLTRDVALLVLLPSLLLATVAVVAFLRWCFRERQID
jgi:NSS family neurotransmitter:Na+ symporter